MSTQWKSNQVKFKQIIHQWCSTVKGLKIYVAQVWYATEPFELSIFMEKLLSLDIESQLCNCSLMYKSDSII